MSNDPRVPYPGGQGRVPGDYNAQFSRMNIGASSFVPNVQAPTFIPGGHGMPPGYPPHYGGGYQMHGHMYGRPPGMHMSPGVHPHSVHHGGGYPMHQPMHGQQHAMHSAQQRQAFAPPSDTQFQQQSTTFPPKSQQQPPNTSEPHPPIQSKPPVPEPVSEKTPPEPEPTQDNPVDSWEDRVGDEAPSDSDSPQSRPAAATSKEPVTADTKKVSDGGSGNSSKDSEEVKPKASSREKSRSKGDSSKAAAQLMQVTPKAEDEKENVNIIFIGHVDAGKSTIGGHIMYLTGQVDKRTLEKYEREAKEKNRETWYLSWALDTNQEERDKGKTVEVGRASFETEKKRFTILDAPGHAGFVPNMISGAAQADIGVLVISARKGEFETGFERKGQTREHAMLAKTAGVKHLVVLINKMDDPTVKWLEDRYEECKTKLTPFLKKVGFNPKTDIFYIPVSGLTGANLKDTAADGVCPWYRGPPFISYLNDLPTISREDTGPFRMPISDKYKDMGTVVMGKVESGAVTKGNTLVLMPNRVSVEVLSVTRVEEDVTAAYSGDNIKLKLKGVEEEDISPGFVLCDPASPCHIGQRFEAQIAVLEHKSIICAGYSAVLHVHAVSEEVQITQLRALIDRKTGKRLPQKPRFVKQDQVVLAVLETSGIICLETFKEFPQMARFTLRDEGKTIAIGKVLKLLD